MWHILFVGRLVPLFWISGNVSSGFQSQSFWLFFGGECNVHSPKSTSGATPADLLMTNGTPITSPHSLSEEELGLDSNGQPPEQKTNACGISLQIKAVTSQIRFCIVDNGIWRGRSDRFHIVLIYNAYVFV